MFTETEQLCRAVLIVDKEYIRMSNKYLGGKVKVKISPLNIKNVRAHLVNILAEDIHQMCIRNSNRI